MARPKRSTHQIAVTAMLSALSLVILYFSALMPTARLGVVAMAGLVPAAAVVSMGLGSGFYCYLVTSVLGLILVPDKANVLVYILFLGLYPVVKCCCEMAQSILLGWLGKLIFFNIMLGVFWFGMRAVILPFLPAALNTIWLIWLVGHIAFIIYDIGFSKLIAFYTVRIDKMLRKFR